MIDVRIPFRKKRTMPSESLTVGLPAWFRPKKTRDKVCLGDDNLSLYETSLDIHRVEGILVPRKMALFVLNRDSSAFAHTKKTSNASRPVGR